MLKIRNKETGLSLLRSLPFLLTLGLFLSLMLTTIGSEARAEGSQSDTEEDTLPEYSITLSDSQSSSSCSSVAISGNTVTITDAGSYTLSGSLSDGRICVDTDKESRVRLILAGVRITSSDSAAIYVRSADKVVILLEDGTDNTLISSGSFMQTDENNIDAVVFSKDDLTIKGNGTLNVTSSDGHGIVSKDDLKIKGGLISVTSARKALSANDSITIDDGNLTLNAGTEGLEANNVVINGGSISVQAGDDGINATFLSDVSRPAIEMNGGSLTIVMGTGDTDGIDSNGDLVMTGGTIDVTGSSAFDIDGSISFTGGTVIINGQQVDSIPNQMMGLGGFGGMGRGGRQNMGGSPEEAFSGENGFFPGQAADGNFNGQQFDRPEGFGGMNGGHRRPDNFTSSGNG